MTVKRFDGPTQQVETDAGLLDARKGAGEAQRSLGLQKRAPVGGSIRRLLVPGEGKEICHRHAEHLGDPLQPARRNAVRALFVFLHLLERHADELAELGLRQAALQAQRAHALPDLGVAGISAASCHFGLQWIAPNGEGHRDPDRWTAGPARAECYADVQRTT